MKKRLWLVSVLALLCSLAWAQGPNESGIYYKDANGKKGESLKTALCKIIRPHKKIGYDGLYEAYKKTDTRADGFVRDWYSNTTNYRHVVDKAGNYSKEGDCYNREHSVPQSWFKGSSSTGEIECDIVHVLPTDGYVNNRRSNYPFGEVSNITYQSNNGYCKLGGCKTAGYSSTVFEPNDEIKGDLARIYFYMATCYEGESDDWGNSVFTGNVYNPFSQWTYDMLLRWAQLDPIDDVELARNNAVYETQKNRNPFVDYPGLEDYVWGSKTDMPFYYDSYEGGEANYVAMPVFSPEAGSYYNEVEVTLSCATDDAAIYYTTDGADASEQSIPYEGPFTLTETSTIKAVAIKEGNRSSQATATYIIRTNSGGDNPADGELALNNAFFGTSYTGSLGNSGGDLTGTQNGVTVTYSLGSGSYRYCNDKQIRLYAGNTLTVSSSAGNLQEIEFVLATSSSKTLSASTGIMSGLVWTGDTNEVTFSVDSGGGNMQITSLKVKLAGSQGPDFVDVCHPSSLDGQRVVYNLRGQRVTNPTRGLYIVDGKKVYIP